MPKAFVKKQKPKLKALAKVVPYIVLLKRNLLINSTFAAQLSYYLLIWMIDSRFSNNRANNLST